MSASNSLNIVDQLEPGHVTELGAADNNKATNPNDTHGFDNSDTPMALDEQIVRATWT